MQSKMRTNGAFLRSFDSKRYQELQQQKQEILRKQQELKNIKRKSKVGGKDKVLVNIDAEEGCSNVESESDLEDPEKIKLNSFYPQKINKNNDERADKVELDTEQTVEELDSDSEGHNTVKDTIVPKEKPANNCVTISDSNKSTITDQVQLVECSNKSKRNVITVIATIEATDTDLRSLEAEITETGSGDRTNSEMVTDVAKLSLEVEKSEKLNSKSENDADYENISKIDEKNCDTVNMNGDIHMQVTCKNEFNTSDSVKKKKKPPELPERKYYCKVKAPKNEMNISSSSAEFDSELSFESGIVYDPQRLIITEEQLSSLYVTSSSSG